MPKLCWSPLSPPSFSNLPECREIWLTQKSDFPTFTSHWIKRVEAYSNLTSISSDLWIKWQACLVFSWSNHTNIYSMTYGHGSSWNMQDWSGESFMWRCVTSFSSCNSSCRCGEVVSFAHMLVFRSSGSSWWNWWTTNKLMSSGHNTGEHWRQVLPLVLCILTVLVWSCMCPFRTNLCAWLCPNGFMSLDPSIRHNWITQKQCVFRAQAH